MEKKSNYKKWFLFLAIITFASFIAALVASLFGIAIMAMVTPLIADSKLAPLSSKKWPRLLSAFILMELGVFIMALLSIDLIRMEPSLIILIGLVDGAVFFLIGLLIMIGFKK